MIVVYDVSSGETFANVRRWIQEIDNNCDNVSRILGELCVCFLYVGQHVADLYQLC